MVVAACENKPAPTAILTLVVAEPRRSRTAQPWPASRQFTGIVSDHDQTRSNSHAATWRGRSGPRLAAGQLSGMAVSAMLS
jgi:hypothetical protein